MQVGAHTPSEHPLAEAAARNADLVQIFLSDPQSWKKPKPREDAAELRSAPIPVIVHAPYLINVCADNNRVRIPSRKILQETCDAATEIDADAVVVHGGHVTGDGPQEEGILRWKKALEALDTDRQVLIENTAGGDKALARRVEWIGKLWGRSARSESGSSSTHVTPGRAVSPSTSWWSGSAPPPDASTWFTPTTRRTASTRDATVMRTSGRVRFPEMSWRGR